MNSKVYPILLCFLKKYDDESLNHAENKKIFYDDLINTEENIYILIAKKNSFRIFEITNLKTKRSRYFAIFENLLSQNYIIVETVEKPRI